MNLHKIAARPFGIHRHKVRTLAVLDSSTPSFHRFHFSLVFRQCCHATIQMPAVVRAVAEPEGSPFCSADLFMSGSDDGTVRQTDIREPPRPAGRSDEATSALENANIIGAQPC